MIPGNFIYFPPNISTVISKRAFIVGCPRSGTTLLQSMIASHPQVVSFPETHFFSGTLPVNPVLRKCKIHGPKSRRTITRFLTNNGYGTLHPFGERPLYAFYTYKSWCQKLTGILDRMIAQEARRRGSHGPVWGLEKTPRHLYYVSSIEQSPEPNKFLHVLRRGSDVVASLHLATRQYPEEWGGERSVKKCINWWNSSMRTSLKYRRDPHHFFVVYEQLVETPEVVLKVICDFLDLDYRQAMSRDFHHTAGALTQEEEKWKDQNRNSTLGTSNKLHKHFRPAEIQYITENLLDIDLSRFYH